MPAEPGSHCSTPVRQVEPSEVTNSSVDPCDLGRSLHGCHPSSACVQLVAPPSENSPTSSMPLRPRNFSAVVQTCRSSLAIRDSGHATHATPEALNRPTGQFSQCIPSADGALPGAHAAQAMGIPIPFVTILAWPTLHLVHPHLVAETCSPAPQNEHMPP